MTTASRHPIVRLTGALLAAATLAACSGSADTGSSTLRTAEAGSAPVTRPVTNDGVITQSGTIRIDHADWRSIGYRWDWSAIPRLAEPGKVIHVDPAGDVLILQDAQGTVSALETSSGRTRWAANVTNSLTRILGATRINDLVFSFSGPAIHVLDVNTGNFQTRQDLDVVVGTPGLVDGGRIIFGTPTGRVYAHDFGTETGRLRPPPLDVGGGAWAYQIGGSINSTPVMVAGRVGVVTDTGLVFFIDPISASGVGRGRMYDGTDTDPITDGQRLFVASRDQSLYAFDSSGNLVWRYPTASPLADQPTVHIPKGDPAASVLYVHIPGEGLTAFDGPTGDVLWQNPGVTGTAVAIRAGDVVVASGQTVSLLDDRDGSVIERFRVPGLQRVVVDQLEDGTLYAIASDGHIARFAPRR